MKLHFPLYKAPVENSPSYAGKGVSILSNEKSDNCFRMGIGATIVVNCPYCNKKNYMDCGEDDIGKCQSCNNLILKDPNAERLITYAELRAGLGLITKDTEIGMISEVELESGWSHGNPNPDFLKGYEIRKDPTTEDGWYQAKIDKNDAYELLRTPDYETWQGDCWQFYDGKPMIYIGEWSAEDFDSNKGNKTLEEFYITVLGPDFRDAIDYADSVCKYIFQSQDGKVYKGHFDFD